MNMNVFEWELSHRYYLRHPWKWVKHLFRNIGFAWSRVTKGYCASDVWDLDSWLLEILPPMLRYLADKGSAYPGVPPFETPEEWHAWLYKMAGQLESVQDAWSDRNEYNNIFTDEARARWFSRECELFEARDKLTKETFAELIEHLHKLWN